MRHPRLSAILLSLLAATLVPTACKPRDPEPTASAPLAPVAPVAPTAGQIDTLQAETRATAVQINDYAYARRTEFTAHMREQLNRIDAELAELTTSLAKSTDAARANAQPKLEALRDKASALRKQLDTVETSTESSWNEVKVGVAKGYEDLKDGFRQARQWVSDAIAP